MLNNFIRYYIFGLLIFSILISIFFNSENSNIILNNPDNPLILNNNFSWPVPGCTTITSRFGYRTSPTTGASTYHGGIDIAAVEGSNVIAIFPGKVIYTGFLGANGFSIIIENSPYTVTYSHLSPNFIVSVGNYVSQGNIIAKIGPKIIYGVYNNPYKDSSGNPTNGATTGPHLHFSIKKDGKAVNPLEFY